MGFGSPALMRAGLRAVRDASACAVGTVTLDSFTRTGNHAAARAALARRTNLNGYPLVTHGAAVTRDVLAGIADEDFPVQVRHGSALPSEIIKKMLGCGLAATEGGPISYCLPYSRVPLADAVADWGRACDLLADAGNAHLESFGGCLLGQLCPPGLLIAVAIIEGIFARAHGIRSISLSYAQQTHHDQDREALAALHALIAEFLPDVDTHVVVYTYMGVFPRTRGGCLELLADSARLAVAGGADRLVVKTPAEAFRIPTVTENVAALEYAARVAGETTKATIPAKRPPPDALTANETYTEARSLIERTLDLGGTIGSAIVTAFERGYLDVPYCLHPDNANRSRGYRDGTGRLGWASVGAMPITAAGTRRREVTSDGLITMLHQVARRYDGRPGPTVTAAGQEPTKPPRRSRRTPRETHVPAPFLDVR
jgi:methylaspartate mutase epsilon subunit